MPPNALTQYSVNHPNKSWNNFKNSNAGRDYKKIKEVIFTDQGEICAYCEQSVRKPNPHKQRIEHFHSKSDISNSNVNWALEWKNVIGVCLGGSYNISDAKISYPLPMNLSCDSHKAHLENKKVLSKQCEGYVLDPLDIVATPALFIFDKSNGELHVNSSVCGQYTPKYNNFSTVDELVKNTIEVLNLNCDRLTAHRLKIFRSYEHKIKLARNNKNTQIHSQLAKTWFNKKWPNFFTTRRIILGHHAEQYLKAMQYNG
jgi:uncharacterized protein (TIGR02646 family)